MLVTTPAVILRTYAYGDTSRIVRLATRDAGLQSVIAKGAMRARSRFGGRLQVLSEGVAQIHHRATRDLQTLSDFDVVDQHVALAADLRRFAAGAALAELHLRAAHEEPQPPLFDTLVEALRRLGEAASDRVPYVGLAALWHAVGVIGFGPETEACVRCGRVLDADASFALAEGGLLCAACGRGGDRGRLRAADQAALRAFCAGRSEGVELPARHLTAHRRLLGRFIRRHVTDDAPLPALAFWEATD